jgi:hypothetical protein
MMDQDILSWDGARNERNVAKDVNGFMSRIGLTRRWPENTDGRVEEERGLFRGLETQGGRSIEGGAQ